MFDSFTDSDLVHITGEDPHTGIVASVDIAAQAMVTCVEDERLEFQVCEDYSHMSMICT